MLFLSLSLNSQLLINKRPQSGRWIHTSVSHFNNNNNNNNPQILKQDHNSLLNLNLNNIETKIIGLPSEGDEMKIDQYIDREVEFITESLYEHLTLIEDLTSLYKTHRL